MKYIISAALLILFASCETILDLEQPPQTPRLVVSCQLSNLDTVTIVKVARSIGILEEDSMSRLNGATVVLLLDGALWDTLPRVQNYNGYDNWALHQSGNAPLPIMAGHQVEVRVTHPSFGTANCVAEVPNLVTPTLAKYRPNGAADPINGGTTDVVDIDFQDPPGVENYYEIQLISYDSLSGNIAATFNVGGLDPSIEAGPTGNSVLLRDSDFDGQLAHITVTVDAYIDPTFYPLTHVVFRSITKDRFLYGRSMVRQQDALGNPFAEPASLYSNITNGLGILTLSNAVMVPIVL